jgi:DNA-binding MarR family transcriptional regulator
MTKMSAPRAGTALQHFHDGLPEKLAESGVSPRAAEALLAFDSAVFGWHRRMMKGELPARLIAEMGVDLELSQFHALTAINRIQCGVGRAQAAEVTVGLLAEEMSLDPSRASRIASALIAGGWLKRAVAQDDARKTVLVLTDKARKVFARFRDLKWQKLLEVFSDWSEADIEAFSRLFTRYSEGTARVYSAGE